MKKAGKQGRKKLSRAAQRRVSEKIEKIRREEPGRDPKQAIAMSYSMERAHRLGRNGKYRRAGRKSRRRSSRRG